MGKKPKEISLKVLDALRQGRLKDYGNQKKTLARALTREFNDLGYAVSEEEIRWRIRYYTGNFGNNDKIIKFFMDMKFRGGGYVNPARSLFNKTYGKDNIIIGHLHTVDNFEKPGSKKTHVMGCACKIPATYDASASYRWFNGFGHLKNKYFQNWSLEALKKTGVVKELPKL